MQQKRLEEDMLTKITELHEKINDKQKKIIEEMDERFEKFRESILVKIKEGDDRTLQLSDLTQMKLEQLLDEEFAKICRENWI